VRRYTEITEDEFTQRHNEAQRRINVAFG
jgi:hypothetical protein